MLDARNLWLDLIRGISALLVCAGHLRNAILVDFSDLPHSNALLKVFYALTGLGHQAVMVFFVLSGYFVGGAVLRAGANFNWQNYLISRLTRLWVVLLPSLLLTWLIGLLVANWAPEALTGIFFERWHSGPKPGEYSVSLTTFLANFFFLQTITSPVFGFNGPLWSLANEFWYYMLFPLLVFAAGVTGKAKRLPRLLVLLIAIAPVLLLPQSLMLGFLVWLMGVAVYCLQARIQLISKPVIYAALMVALVLFALALVFSRTAGVTFQTDTLVAFAFAWLCLVLTRLSFPTSPWFKKLALYSSETSYSLYLCHFPVVILITTFVYQSQKLAPSSFALLQFFGWFLFLLGVGFVMWRLFESKTPFVRKQVMSIFGKA